MSLLTYGGFLQASAAQSIGRAPQSDALFNPSTDSRTLRAGDAFVCLRGPSFDGHDYIAQALRAGAAAVVFDDRAKLPPAAGVPALLVSDAKAAYLKGASAAARLAPALRIAITGSNGKTTTKALCAQLVSSVGEVLAAPQNENNELGVARLCYALQRSTRIAVFEFGARHPGDIARLVEIVPPHIAVLTNIGEAHLEFFSSREELARTKFAIFSRAARAVCNAGDRATLELAKSTGIAEQALWVRMPGDPPVQGLTLEAAPRRDGRVELRFGSACEAASWRLVGEHHLRDALLAAAAALLAGAGLGDIAAAFGGLRLPPGRFEVHRLRGGITLVYDAYNSNPTSAACALRAFAQLPAARHLAVLGSMAELGPQAQEQHERIGALAWAAGLDVLLCGGSFAAALAQGALRAGMPAEALFRYRDNPDAAAELRRRLKAGDALLLKGSRVEELEQVMAELMSSEVAAS